MFDWSKSCDSPTVGFVARSALSFLPELGV